MPLSELSIVKFENLTLRAQLLQLQLQQVMAEGSAQVAAMRIEAGADPTALYDPQRRCFVTKGPAAVTPADPAASAAPAAPAISA